MIVASISRMTLGQKGWAYREFDDMEQFLDWLLDDPELVSGVQYVYEFVGGKAVEVANWHAQLKEIEQSAAADAKHKVLWSYPGVL